MTSPHSPEEQRQAARAAITATLEALLDLGVSKGIIVEVLAIAAVGLGKTIAVRRARTRPSNDQPAGPPEDQR